MSRGRLRIMARRSNRPSKSRSSNSTNRQDMNSSFQKRLDIAAQGIDKLPSRAYTDAENRRWAERQLAEVMAEFSLTRDEALAQAQEHAPTIGGWLTQEVR